MAAVQAWGARRVEPKLIPTFGLRHQAVRRLLSLAPWVVLYVAANQLGLAAVIAMASTIAGGVSAYQWAFTVMQLPHAIVSVSLISAAFPRLAAAAARDEDPTDVLNGATRAIVGLLLPGAAVLAAVAPAAGIALVGEAGGQLVAAGIGGFAVSLVPFSMFQLLTRTSYAYEDTRSPAVINLAVNLVNVAVDLAVLLLVADPSVRVAGLALGHAASYVAGCALLGARLRRQRGIHAARGLDGWSNAAFRGAACAAIAGGIVVAASASTQMLAAVVASVAVLVAAALYLGWLAISPVAGLPAIRRRVTGRRA